MVTAAHVRGAGQAVSPDETVEGQLHVLRLLTRFNVGGPARQALAIQPEMARLAVTTTLAGGMVQPGEADLAELMGCGEVHRLPELGRAINPASDLKAVAGVYRLIRAVHPQIVHTHMAKAGMVGRLAAAAARVPVRVHTFHGHTLHGYFGPAASQAVVRAERILAGASTALVAVSHQIRDDLLERGVGSPGRFHVVGPGLDLSPYDEAAGKGPLLRRRLGIGAADAVVGFAGRLVPVKGIAGFLDAVGPLMARRPDVHVVIAGDGPDMALVRRAQDRSWGARVHALGWVADMAEFYGAANVVVLSSHNEGTPLALIEAGAAGVAVVATRVGGVAEVVDHGVNGLLVEPGTASRLEEAIDAVLTDEGLAARLGAGGRAASRSYGAAAAAGALNQLYRHLLSSGVPRSAPGDQESFRS